MSRTPSKGFTYGICRSQFAPVRFWEITEDFLKVDDSAEVAAARYMIVPAKNVLIRVGGHHSRIPVIRGEVYTSAAKDRLFVVGCAIASGAHDDLKRRKIRGYRIVVSYSRGHRSVEVVDKLDARTLRSTW